MAFSPRVNLHELAEACAMPSWIPGCVAMCSFLVLFSSIDENPKIRTDWMVLGVTWLTLDGNCLAL